MGVQIAPRRLAGLTGDPFGLAIAAPIAGGGVFDLEAFMAAQSDGLYNRFDLTDRLFQEDVGPTPADGLGEVIGLAMSQRSWNGLALSELVAGQAEMALNGGFDTNLASWTDADTGTGVSDWSAGKLRCVGSEGATDRAARYQNFAAVVGKMYRISVGWQVVSGQQAGVLIGSAAHSTDYLAYFSAVGAGSGTLVRYVRATGTNIAITLRNGGTGATEVLFDNVSVKEVPGKHGTQPTLSFRPKFQSDGGALFDALDDSLLTTYVAGAGSNFIVTKVAVPASLSATHVIAGTQDGSSNGMYLGVTTAGDLRFKHGGNTALIDSVGTDLRGQTVIVGGTSDGTTIEIFIADASAGTLAQTGAPPTTVPFRLGALNANGTPLAFFGGIVHSLVAGREAISLARFKQIAANL